MKNKYQKGDFLYLPGKKKRELLKTLLFFGISALIFIMGYLSTKTRANYLTIMAVLGCLPASKSAVSAIMYLKIKGCSRKYYDQLKEKLPKATGSFNLYFTSYHKNFDTSHIFVKGLTMIAFTEDDSLQEGLFEEHIKTVLNHDGIKGYNIKLYKDFDKYLQRMEQMMALDNEKGREEAVTKTLYSVSL